MSIADKGEILRLRRFLDEVEADRIALRAKLAAAEGYAAVYMKRAMEAEARVAELEAVLEVADRLAAYLNIACRMETDQGHVAAYRFARAALAKGDK